MIIKGDQQNDLRTYRFANGYTLQETMLLQALKTQAEHGLLMTNPRVTGYTSFAKAVIGVFKLGNCLLYTSPSPRDAHESRMPSSA